MLDTSVAISKYYMIVHSDVSFILGIVLILSGSYYFLLR